MKTVPLRYLAEINPPAPEFEALPEDAEVEFLPLEAVWADSRADQNRRILKSASGGYTRFNSGDIVSPKVTPTFQAARSMRTAHAGVGTTELHVLRARAGVDPRWVCYALRSNGYIREGVAAFQGVAGLQRVPADFVASFRVADHNQQEQRRIADFLDDRVSRIDQIIAARQQQIQQLWLHRSGALAEAVFSQDERMTRCSKLAEIRLGRQRSPQNSEGEFMTPYLRSANVRDGELDLADVYHMNFTPMEQQVFALSPGDVLVSEGSASIEAVGAACRWSEELAGVVCFQNTLLRLRPRNGVLPEFVEVWARASHANGTPGAFATGASILHLGADGVAKMPIPDIGATEQTWRTKRAQEVLRFHEGLTRMIHGEIDLLNEYKKSLITAAVTGEFDATTASTKIPE